MPFSTPPERTMEVVIKKWGNSAAVRIPAAVMKAAKISLEQAVDVREEHGRVVIQPMQSHEYRLDELLAGITTNNCHHAIDTGPARGHEAL
jgi:antitoxin MazE